MTGCAYVTSLDRECGREATTGPHCDLHAVLAQLDDFDFHDPAPITVPASVRPMVDRILSDVRANFDAMPVRIGTRELLGLSTASLRRNESLRQMRHDQ